MINPRETTNYNLERYYDKKKCVECPNMFFIVKEGRQSHQRPGLVKKRGSKACSPKCSRIHVDKSIKEYNKKYRKKKKNETTK